MWTSQTRSCQIVRSRCRGRSIPVLDRDRSCKKREKEGDLTDIGAMGVERPTFPSCILAATRSKTLAVSATNACTLPPRESPSRPVEERSWRALG